MRVEVRLYDILKDRIKKEISLSDGSISISLDESAVVNDLIDLLGLEKSLIGIITINNVQADFDSKLKNGDQVNLLSQMFGG